MHEDATKSSMQNVNVNVNVNANVLYLAHFVSKVFEHKEKHIKKKTKMATLPIVVTGF